MILNYLPTKALVELRIIIIHHHLSSIYIHTVRIIINLHYICLVSWIYMLIIYLLTRFRIQIVPFESSRHYFVLSMTRINYLSVWAEALVKLSMRTMVALSSWFLVVFHASTPLFYNKIFILSVLRCLSVVVWAIDRFNHHSLFIPLALSLHRILLRTYHSIIAIWISLTWIWHTLILMFIVSYCTDMSRFLLIFVI